MFYDGGTDDAPELYFATPQPRPNSRMMREFHALLGARDAQIGPLLQKMQWHPQMLKILLYETSKGEL